jgi:hypothetical protein
MPTHEANEGFIILDIPTLSEHALSAHLRVADSRRVAREWQIEAYLTTPEGVPVEQGSSHILANLA